MSFYIRTEWKQTFYIFSRYICRVWITATTPHLSVLFSPESSDAFIDFFPMVYPNIPSQIDLNITGNVCNASQVYIIYIMLYLHHVTWEKKSSRWSMPIFLFIVISRARRIGHRHGTNCVAVRGLRAHASVAKTRFQKQFLPATCGEQRVSQASSDRAAPSSDALPQRQSTS